MRLYPNLCYILQTRYTSFIQRYSEVSQVRSTESDERVFILYRVNQVVVLILITKIYIQVIQNRFFFLFMCTITFVYKLTFNINILWQVIINWIINFATISHLFDKLMSISQFHEVLYSKVSNFNFWLKKITKALQYKDNSKS